MKRGLQTRDAEMELTGILGDTRQVAYARM